MIRKLSLGGDEANCFLVGEEGGSVFIVDLGKRAGQMVFNRYLKEHYSKLEGVLLTHGHFDHIGGLENVPEGIPIFLSADDMDCLREPKRNVSFLDGEPLVLPERIAPYPLEDEDEIALPSFSLEVIATPFHTPGSVCFYYEKGDERALFTGDTLFAMGIGRQDLPGGRPALVRGSLSKLRKLDPMITIYPGHGPSSTLGKALAYADYYL